MSETKASRLERYRIEGAVTFINGVIQGAREQDDAGLLLCAENVEKALRCLRVDLAAARADIATYVQVSAEQQGEIERLNKLLNTPLTADWFEGVRVEAAHQIERWGSDHDAGKTPLDWFWLIGFLAQKATASAISGDSEKAKHHTISTGAAMFNWFRALSGDDNRMRPGIEPPGDGT